MLKKIISKQLNSKECFGCRIDSPIGTKVRYYNLEGGFTLGLFNCNKMFMGHPGMIHGGITATILDEVMCRSYVVNGENIWSATVEMTIKYNKPVPYEQELRAVSKITGETDKVFFTKSWLISPDNEIAAEGSGTYIKLDKRHMDRFGMDENSLIMAVGEQDPEYVDLPDEIN